MIKLISMSAIKKIFTLIIFVVFHLHSQAQMKSDSIYSINIQGNVFNASTKMPLEGLNVAYSNKTSSFTDSLGAFSIAVPSTEIAITISGNGFQTQTVLVKKREFFDVYMHEDKYPSAQQQSYNDFYSSRPLLYTSKTVSSISENSDTWQNPGLSAEEALHEKISGLRVISKTGMPGIGANMFLRGYSSMYGSNQPLVVVDGFVLDNPYEYNSIITGYISNPLSYIDITDIENISLIKDANSLYGTRSGNGVLFISTRRSRDIATKIDFNVLAGINSAPKQQPMLESDDYKRYVSEILQSSELTSDQIQSLPFMNDGLNSTNYYKYNNNTNWQDQIFDAGVFQKYNLRISGGDDIALYTLSVGYSNHDGIIKNTGFKRYNARFNSDIKVSPKFIMNASVSYSNNNFKLNEEGLVNTSSIHQSLYKAPFLFPYVKNENNVVSPIMEDADDFGISNPLVIVNNTEATSENYQIFALFNAKYKITEELSISNQVGVDFHKARNSLFLPHLGIAADTLEQGVAENKMAHQVTRFYNISNDFRIQYSHVFNLIHHFSALAGTRLARLQSEDDWAQSHNSPNDNMKTINTGTNIFRTIGGYLSDINRLTYYANAEYNYAHRYLLSFNMSLDGSSNFGKEATGLSLFNSKFGVFPAISGAWLVSSESFMSNINVVDLVKVRASYGLTGNSNFGEFPSSKYYESQNFIGSQGLVKGSLWTSSLQWETVTKSNFGVDISALKNKVALSFDFYNNTTSDMLNVLPADPQSGFSYYIDNDGSFQSKGFDITAFFRAIDGKKLKWDISLNYSQYKTEILELPYDNKVTSIYGANILSAVGQPLGVFYGYKTNGVYSTQAEAEADGFSTILPNTDLSPFSAGDVIFEDRNNDKIIDENDMQIIGDPNPDFTCMISNRISWNGISLEAVISYTSGKDVFNHLRYQLESMQNTNNQTQAVLNRWRNEGQITDIPKASANDPQGNARFSDRWIEDGSFLRLKYITLSYKVPIKQQYIRGLEVFVTGKNLVTLTKYQGYDPEFSISEFSLAQGIDIGMVPQAKSIYAGIKMNF